MAHHVSLQGMLLAALRRCSAVHAQLSILRTSSNTTGLPWHPPSAFA